MMAKVSFLNSQQYIRAIRTGVIADTTLANPVRVWDGPGQAFTVEPLVEDGQLDVQQLARLGVCISDHASHAEATQQTDRLARFCPHWLLVLPPQPVPALTLPSQTVLFRLTDCELARFVRQILRLGGRDLRMSRPTADGELFVQIDACPVYAALNQWFKDGLAYHMVKPGVWLPYATTHPLLDRFHSPSNGFVLIDARGQQTSYSCGFAPLLRQGEWCLPEQSAVQFRSCEYPIRSCEYQDKPVCLRPRLRPNRSITAAFPTLWLLMHRACEQLERLVHELDSRQLERLQVGLLQANPELEPTLLLLHQPERHESLSVVLPPSTSQPLVAHRGLRNLYLPQGYRLEPNLRLDWLRERLAADSKYIYCLLPGSNADQFQIQQFPMSAFTPLSEWVEYTTTAPEPIAPVSAQLDWLQLIPYEVRQDAQPTHAEKPVTIRTTQSANPPRPTPPPVQRGQALPRSDNPEQSTAMQPNLGPTETKLNQAIVQFLEQLEPFHSAAHQALWPELAQLYAQLGQHLDASICFANALWDQPNLREDWVRSWSSSYTAKVDTQFLEQKIQSLLANTLPGYADLVTMFAVVLDTSLSESPPPALTRQLRSICVWVELFEHLYPVRVVWLLWVALSQLTGDLLILARARDRLLQRLLDRGLRREIDLPAFLRYTHHQRQGCVQTIGRSTLDQLAQQIQARSWGKHGFVLYALAYGYARINDSSRADQLQTQARELLDNLQPSSEDSWSSAPTVKGWLILAYQTLIQQTLAGRDLNELRSVQLTEQRRLLTSRESYELDKICRRSALLEPVDMINPFRRFDVHKDQLAEQLIALEDANTPAEIEKAF